MSAATPTHALLSWMAHTTLSTVRDVREELGIAVAYRGIHAATARIVPRRSLAKRCHVQQAAWCRERIAFLRARLTATTGSPR